MKDVCDIDFQACEPPMLTGSFKHRARSLGDRQCAPVLAEQRQGLDRRAQSASHLRSVSCSLKECDGTFIDF